MGRLKSPTKKPAATSHVLSPRPSHAPFFSIKGLAAAAGAASSSESDSEDDDVVIVDKTSNSPSSKRPLPEDIKDDNGSKKPKKKRKTKAAKRAAREEKERAAFAVAAAAASNATSGVESGNSTSKEEGEIDEFAHMFIVDTTPAHVAPNMQFGQVTADEEESDGEEEDLPLAHYDVNGIAVPGDEDKDYEATEGAMTPLFDGEHELRRAIESRINDDSAAKVTGRYYKEVDLTRTCALCGEQGHTSRECTHAQCFTCGEVDGDHEARNCPVSLICSSCGSRGHYARQCTLASNQRLGFGNRCSICSSSIHNAPNCPSHWRIYDKTDAKPKSNPSIVFACANCGSTKDHFIDDCLLPRMHPLRHVDSSAFNKRALPGYRSRKQDRQSQIMQDEEDVDFFAQRNGKRKDRSGREERYTPSRSDPFTRGGGDTPSRGSGRRGGSHIHFSRESFDRFGSGGGSASSSRRGSDRDSDRSGYDSPRDSRSRPSGGGSRSGAPSLMSRMGLQGGSKPSPRYNGGYF